MATTIKKIAESLGLSAPTVSHILNNRGRFRDETRQRVFRAAQEFGYMPNGAARSMRNQRSLQVAAPIRNNPAQHSATSPLTKPSWALTKDWNRRGICCRWCIGDVGLKGPQSPPLRERMFDGMIIIRLFPMMCWSAMGRTDSTFGLG